MPGRTAKTEHGTKDERLKNVQRRIGFTASPVPAAQSALAALTAEHGQWPLGRAQVIVALGGDGFMLQTLHDTQALDVLKSTKRASTSMIQRRLRIGYNRAARIMDLMEEKGIVGPENGSSPREILVDLDSL